jgi:GNAT superfamily N-acetyltransferase
MRVRQIEDEAGELFTGTGLIDEERDESFPVDELVHLIELGQVWLMCDAGDTAVGMVIVSIRDAAVYVEEIDVLPTYGRRGLGARLLEHVCDWARERGCPAVTLSTFRDVAWNGPFYRKHGFRDLTENEWTPGMAEIRRKESEHGLKVDERVFMRRDLIGAKGSAGAVTRRYVQGI